MDSGPEDAGFVCFQSLIHKSNLFDKMSILRHSYPKQEIASLRSHDNINAIKPQLRFEESRQG